MMDLSEISLTLLKGVLKKDPVLLSASKKRQVSTDLRLLPVFFNL